MYTIWSPNYLTSVCMFCYPVLTTVKNVGLARTNRLFICYTELLFHFKHRSFID